MKEYLFIGEKRSEQAIRNDWTWQKGISTAKFLFDALREIGITPEEQEFQNLWSDEGKLQEVVTEKCVVGMGQKVHKKLKEMGIEHIDIVHPAARGIYKRKEVYREHLRGRLV
jgi:hypothetical protein